MTTFADFQTTGPSMPDRLIKRPEPILFLLCLVLGLGITAWRANLDASSKRATARNEALAWCAAIEPNLNEALFAAQAPAVLARNGGRIIPDFSKIHTQLGKIQDYDYVLYTTPKAIFSKRGTVTLKNAVQQPVRARNVEFHLALEPSSGWHNKSEIVFELVITLLISGLSCLLVNTLRSRREMEAALANESRRLARETADRKQVEEEFHTAKQTSAATQTDLKQLRSLLQQAETTTAAWSAQLQNMAQAKKESEAASQAKIQQTQATLLERETKINALLSARETADRKLAELEFANEDLKAHFLASQHAEACVAELTARLQETEAELQRHRDMLSASIQLTEELSPAEPAPPEDNLPAAIPKEEKEEDTVPWETEEPAPQAPEAVALPLPSKTDELPVFEPVPATEDVQPEPSVAPTTPPEDDSEAKTDQKPKGKRKKSRHDNQIPLFGGPEPENEPTAPLDTKNETPEKLSEPFVDPKQPFESPRDEQKKNTPLNPAQLRKAVHELMPLLAGEDPGALECFQEHQETFRSASTEEAFMQFEQLLKENSFAPALELLKKAARRHNAI